MKNYFFAFALVFLAGLVSAQNYMVNTSALTLNGIGATNFGFYFNVSSNTTLNSVTLSYNTTITLQFANGTYIMNSTNITGLGNIAGTPVNYTVYPFNYNLTANNTYEVVILKTGTQVYYYNGAQSHPFAVGSIVTMKNSMQDNVNYTDVDRGVLYMDYGPTNAYQSFDETTNTALVTNVSFSNATTTVSYSNVNYQQLNLSTLPLNALTVTVSATNYQPRTYYVTNNGISAVAVNAYLLATSQGQFVVFLVQSPNGAPISGVSVSAARQFGSVWTTIAQSVSDGSGSASFFLSPSTSYQMTFSAFSYVTTTNTVTPASSQYTIRLQTTNFSITVAPSNSNLTYYFTPTNPSVSYLQQYQNLSFYINDQQNNLSWFNVSIYANGSLLSSSNWSNTTSGTWVNFTNLNNSQYYFANNTDASYTGVVTISRFVPNEGYYQWSYTQTWVISNTTYSPNSLQGALDQTAGNNTAYLFILLFGCVVIIYAATMFGGQGLISGAIAILIAGMLMLIGLMRNVDGSIAWGVFGVIVFFIGSLLYLRGVI